MFEDAIITLEQVLKFDQGNDEAFFNLGFLYERNEQFEKAIEFLTKHLF